MNANAPLLLSLPLVLGCTSSTVAAEPQTETSSSDFSPIRYGDGEEEVAYRQPFFPGASYDERVPTPESVLGRMHATRLSHHDEIVECFRRFAAASPRLVLDRYGVTHEGRELVYAVATSARNHERLDEILARHAALRDSGEAGASDLDDLPAIAWMGYSIHGDELSGSDAAVALAYHFAASTDAEVAALLDDTVVVIDPVMNPDGRERIISMVEQAAGRTPSLDYASMHRGRWPHGRGNHYLFDMNRDWMTGVQPETRGRWSVLLRFPPQLFVDAHEMGSLDTFLFYPQSKPLSPQLPEKHLAWQKRYAEDAAAAFDVHGWRYYSREWADGWGPYYSDSWGSLSGATGLLYEQSATYGSPLRRRSGRVITYRESVHHQLTASWANLRTLATNRQEILDDYVATMARNRGAEHDRTFVWRPDGNDSRTRELLRILLGQGIEVRRTTEAIELSAAVHILDGKNETVTIPAGAYLVPPRQARSPMVRSYLGFDPRIDLASLKEEREELEQKGRSTMYDLTAWSLPHALGLDAWWGVAATIVGETITTVPATNPLLIPATSAPFPVAWAVDGADDASVTFAARAMEAGVRVHLADEPFRVGDRLLPRGSLLVQRSENSFDAPTLIRKVYAAATEAGVAEVLPAGTGLAPGDEADFGGRHFDLLARPRVAVVANAPISSESYGHLWHQLDLVLGLPFSILDASSLGGVDLRRYNVLILPPAWGNVNGVLEPMREELETWVRGGGTLIACGGSAAALTRERLGLSRVVLRRHALEELDTFRTAAQREREARQVEIDEREVWGDPPLESEETDETETVEDATEPAAEADAPAEIEEEADAWLRRFGPRGATARGIVDPDSWLTVGSGAELPVPVSGSNVFLTDGSVRTAVRLADEDSLRLGGLVWPEARERLAHSAWLTVESSGNGQVILFTQTPGFRGYHLATGRLFANAVVYGPGAGARQPIGW